MAEHGLFLRRIAGAILRDESRAEDAMQDAWLAALETRPPQRLSAWLVTVTRRLAARLEREAGRRRRREQAVARENHVPATDSVAARAEVIRLVGEAVAGLPEPFRETLLLRYWEGLPPRGISERMSVPVATVQSRTRRGLQLVRKQLERWAPREERWEQSLALAVGRLHPSEVGGASASATTLGAITMKTKTWLAGASALLLLTVVLAVGITALRPDAAGEQPEGTLAPLRSAAVGRIDAQAAAPELPDEDRVAATAPLPAEKTPSSLSVLVLDSRGRPVEQAELLGGQSAVDMRILTTTSREGRARLDLRPELSVVCARAAGWAPSPVYDLLPLEGSSGELVLQLPLRGTSLVVEVRNDQGALLPGARVFAGREEEVDYRLPDGTLARTAPGFAARTDTLGLARFKALPPGWLRVSVAHDEYAWNTTFATLELARDNRVEVVLEPGITVTGRVCDEIGTPLAQARVERSSSGRAVTTAADGSYRLGPVEAGKIVVVGPLGRRVEKRVKGEPGSVVRWDPRLPSQPAVLGRVVDHGGAALAGWTVHANLDTWPGWRRGVVTDSQGRFAIYAAPSAALRIELREKEQAALPMLSVEGIRAGPEELRLRLPRNPWGRLIGRVERADGLPCADLPLLLRHKTAPDRARLTGGRGLAITPDVDGRFDLEGIPTGHYELVLKGAPFGWLRLCSFELLGGRTIDVGTLAVPAPGMLRTRSWWGAAEPTGDASYLLERRADHVTVLAFRGTFPEELSLAPGRYTLQTEVTPGPQREIEFEVVSEQITEIELELGATCEHVLRVRYASGGVPRGSLLVRVRRLDDGADFLDASVFELEGNAWVARLQLPAGRFEFTARDSRGLEAHTAENLYTSRPGREIRLTLDDAEDPR